MGFMRNYAFAAGTADRALGPIFYVAMKTAGTITNQLFAIYYTDVPNQSFYEVGSYDTGNNFYTGTITWITV